MAEVVLTPRAERDLEAIWLSVAAENPLAADRLLRRISERLLRLASFPLRGSPRPELGAPVRVLVVGRYLVLYEAAPDLVEVVRILHGARHLRDLRR